MSNTVPVTTPTSVRLPKKATTPSPFELAKQNNLVQRGFSGAPLRFDLNSKLEKMKNTVCEPLDSPLNQETEDLLFNYLENMHNSFTNSVDKIYKSIKETKITANPLHQARNIEFEFDSAILAGPESLQNLLNSTAAKVLKDYDNNTNGFKDKFIELQNIQAENKEEEGRKLLETRLKAEQKRIDNLRKFQQELENYILARANYMMQIRYAGQARLMATGNSMEARDGQLTKLPEHGTYNVSGVKFNFINAFLFGDYRGTIHKISEKVSNTGETYIEHSFNPLNKDSREFFKKCTRGTPGVTHVTLKLGTGVSSAYQLYGEMSPSTHGGLRNAALDFKFDFETGICHDIAKSFCKSSKTVKKLTGGSETVEGMLDHHDQLLDNYNMAEANYNENGSDANRKALELARKNYQNFITQFDIFFRDVDDYVLAANSIRTEIGSFDLQGDEIKHYETAKELRGALKHIRGHAMQRSIQDLQSKGADTTELKTLEDQFNTLYSGELPKLKTDRAKTKSATPSAG